MGKRRLTVTDASAGPVRPVKMPDGFAVWNRWTRTVDRGLPYIVRLDVAIEDGRMVCNGIHVERREGGPEVTGEEIRKIPVASILRAAPPPAMKLEHPEVEGKTLTKVGLSLTRLEQRRFEAVLSDLRRRARTANSTAERLRVVADTVRATDVHRRSTTTEVAHALEVSESYARRLIMRARDEADPETDEPYLERTGPRRRKAPRRRKR